jgi:hypothetical protein
MKEGVSFMLMTLLTLPRGAFYRGSRIEISIFGSKIFILPSHPYYPILLALFLDLWRSELLGVSECDPQELLRFCIKGFASVFRPELLWQIRVAGVVKRFPVFREKFIQKVYFPLSQTEHDPHSVLFLFEDGELLCTSYPPKKRKDWIKHLGSILGREQLAEILETSSYRDCGS